ncbi:putative ABC transporter [Neoconidiobolus thromboides FSU 785]|nr:putative ABC transporter [Neoconidiobolus thromboides FSU 785]
MTPYQFLIYIQFLLLTVTSTQSQTHLSTSTSPLLTSIEDKCPPCFNCMLTDFKCYNYGVCNPNNGLCSCPIGFDGQDCTLPLCGALTDGEERKGREGNSSCDCKPGWKGINCNLCNEDKVCDLMVPQGLNGTCYKGGIVVKENHQVCKVTNEKIVEMLGSKKAMVTKSCNRKKESCNFQFWTDEKESFDCKFEQCQFEVEGEEGQQSRVTGCKKIMCECIPGKFLCGENGSIDISDFLSQKIKGPGKFNCDINNKCRFEEPEMNNLILSIFGDDYISLECESSECIHYSELPGLKKPIKEVNRLFIKLAVCSIIIFMILLIVSFYYFSKKKVDNDYMPIDWDDESGKLMAHHVPTTLSFKDICYQIDDKDILNNVHGIAKPGQVMAIMGASGAGKSTFLDILARRNKSGSISGEICINGQILSNKKFRKIVGFVDQEDILMPTLTVYETILNSALLRLPRDMSLQAKKLRVLECMKELKILKIKDNKIGNSEIRGISGGEKRRVSIACEMVTSPSILFLDEPTSGLDAYNAQNVIECLASLAKNYQRTILFTIHQPRSNIYSLFDQLILLADGWLVYSGHAQLAVEHFNKLGYHCPLGYNIADFIIDITQDNNINKNNNNNNNITNNDGDDEYEEYEDYNDNEYENYNDNEYEDNNNNNYESNNNPWSHNPASSPGLELQGPISPINHNQPYLLDGGMRKVLAVLVLGFKKSIMSKILHEELEEFHDNNRHDTISISSAMPITYKKSSFLMQFMILSKRTFKNLYRDPLLMLTNYTISIVLAGLCGSLYYQVSDDIPGFQNRMGLFFFMCALFGFSCLTSIQVFQTERILFMRERANGYYLPITYFLSKILFDILPLRFIPPLIMGVIIYPMVGLNPGMIHFALFLLTLVLFNLTCAAICLCISIFIPSISLANLICSLIMLFSMLFSGLFLNAVTIPPILNFLKYLSVFHYALESLLVNEMRFMQLKDRKFGYDIDIPAATILSTFGFDASKFWFNTTMLGVIGAGTLILAYIGLHFFCKEKR